MSLTSRLSLVLLSVLVLCGVTPVFCITLIPNGGPTPQVGAANTSGTAGYSNSAATCGQIELDVLSGGTDIFQYITFNGGQGLSFDTNGFNYTLTLQGPVVNNAIEFVVFLSHLQGSYTDGLGTTYGPFNASVDTVSAQLNGGATITQNYTPQGQFFAFTGVFDPSNYSAPAFITVNVAQVFPIQTGLDANSSCDMSYTVVISQDAAFAPSSFSSSSSSSTGPSPSSSNFILIPNGGPTPQVGASNTSGTAGYTNAPANCGQIELDVLSGGTDIFQYITFNGGQGVNFDTGGSNYSLTLQGPVVNNAIEFVVFLSHLQGSLTVGLGTTYGPFNASVDTVSAQLNGGATITQNYTQQGQFFAFTGLFDPTNYNAPAFITVNVAQVFPIQTGFYANISCGTSYTVVISQDAAFAPSSFSSSSSSSTGPSSSSSSSPSPSIQGDPQFVGLRGQSYQVHGIDGAVYNIISEQSTQVNARFVFLRSGECPLIGGFADSNCWSHPGSYLGELSFQQLVDGELHAALVTAGPAKKGFAGVQMDGKVVAIGQTVSFGSFSLTVKSTHSVEVTTEHFAFELSNSDMFVNQAVRATVPLSSLSSHGLLGQTHSGKTHPGPLRHVEGNVDDYVIADSDVFGTDFLYNQFQTA